MREQLSASVPPGLSNPSTDAQSIFRAVLQAMANPGRVVGLPIHPPLVSGLNAGASGIALTLCDLDTDVWLAPDCDTREAREFLAFHTGARFSKPSEADFVFIRNGAHLDLFPQLKRGTHLYPDRSATIIAMVDQLSERGLVMLRGPGIPDTRELGVAPVDRGLLTWLTDGIHQFPVGVDVIFASDTSIVAVPRSTHVEVMYVCGRQGW